MFEGVVVEVSSIHFVLFLVASNLILLSWAYFTLKIKLDEIPNQEFPQLTQTQHILLGISQFLEGNLDPGQQKPQDMIETAKSMIPLMIGKKLFPTFFDEIMPGFGPTPSPSSSLTEKSHPGHGEEE